MSPVALDKYVFLNQKIVDIFLISPQKICYGTQWGTSNQKKKKKKKILWRNSKNIFLIPQLIWIYEWLLLGNTNG